jgi:hypothetical protein
VEARLAMARRGFVDGPLEDRIADYVPNLAEPVLELVPAMQAEVAAGAGMVRS